MDKYSIDDMLIKKKIDRISAIEKSLFNKITYYHQLLKEIPRDNERVSVISKSINLQAIAYSKLKI